jgi:hypothetical protein
MSGVEVSGSGVDRGPWLLQQPLQQLGDVRGDAPRLVAGQQVGRCALLSPQCRSVKPTPMRLTIAACRFGSSVMLSSASRTCVSPMRLNSARPAASTSGSAIQTAHGCLTERGRQSTGAAHHRRRWCPLLPPSHHLSPMAAHAGDQPRGGQDDFARRHALGHR